MDIGNNALKLAAKTMLNISKHYLNTPTTPDSNKVGDPYGEHAEMFGVGGPGFVHHIIEETPHAV